KFFTPFRSGGAGCPLLRPQPPHASACRGERPYWWEQAQGLNSARRRAPLVRQNSDVGRAEDRKSVLAEVPGTIRTACRLRRRMPPQLLPRGRGGLFVFSELRRDLKARPIFGLVFPEEAAGMD